MISYASHHFWTALEWRVLQSDPAHGSGFWFVTDQPQWSG